MGITATKMGNNMHNNIVKTVALAAALALPVLLAQPHESQGAAITCSSGVTTGCHFNSTVNTPAIQDSATRSGATGLFPGSHAKHAGSAAGQYAFACTKCHGNAGTYTNSHQSGFKNLTGSSLPGNAYSQGKKVADSNAPTLGTCNNTYCHGPLNTSAAWGSAGPLLCDACHNASKALSGAHMLHYSSATLPGAYTDAPGNVSSSSAYRFACSSCHSQTKGATHAGGPAAAASGYGDAEVFFGFTSATNKGAYSYGTSSNTDARGFKWSANGGSTAGKCNSTYCHSNGQGANGLTTVSWSTTTHAVGCVTCHDTRQTGATPTGLSGKHDKHMNPSSSGSILGTGNGFNCVDCHAKTVSSNSVISDKSRHVNKFVDYSGVKAGGSSHYDASTKGCSNVYCHSNGNAGAISYVNMTSSKAWNGSTFTITTCNKCHGRSGTSYPDYANGGANSATANLHPGHMSWQAAPDTTYCADCHRRTVDPTIVNKFRPYSTMHLNGVPNLYFNTTKTYIGSKATVSQAGYTVTCSQIVCHGSGSMTWGATSGASNACQKCHGSASVGFATVSSAQVAPGGTGRDTAGNTAATAPRVGAHQNHLNSNISAPIKCSACHVKVNAVSDASHLNYSTATVTFQGLALTDSHAPSDSRVSGVVQCSNTYCHTAKYSSGSAAGMTPAWNSTTVFNDAGTTVGDCVVCHAMPPSGYTGHPAALSNTAALSTVYSTCGSCHTNLASTGVTNVTNIFVDKTKHVNGTRDAVAGESSGGQDCSGCHSFYTQMNGSTSSYHHYMQNAGATYPTAAPTSAEDTNRRCLMCHVDHDVFNPSLNANNTTGRSANLRTTIATAPDKTKAPGAGTGTGNYSNSDFNTTNGGLCISCHSASMAKNQAKQLNDTTTYTIAIPFSGGSYTDFQASSHQYNATSTFVTGGSTFNGNCSKCHNDNTAKSKQSAGNQFAPHDGSLRIFAAVMGQTSPTDPTEENMCYRCHSRNTDAVGGTVKPAADKDWYNVSAMTPRTQLMYNIASTYAFKHDVNGTTGLHEGYDEGRAANNGTLSGTNRHVSCVDCHNPHAGSPKGAGVLAQTVSSYTNGGTSANDTVTVAGTPWTTNAYAGWTVKVVAGTGAGKSSVIYSNGTNTLSTKFATSGAALDATSKIIIMKQGTSDGNTISTPAKGVWGLAPTWPAQSGNILTWDDSVNGAGAAGTANAAEELTGQFAAITTWNRTENATIEGQLCIKCHSAYAYGTTPPNTAGGQPTGSASASSATIGVAMRTADKANEFNPNNLGYHPIFARGKNQPVRANYGNTSLVSAVNTAWPKYSAGSIAVSSGLATLTGATLPATALPGWFVYIGATGPTAGSATGASNLQTPGTASTGYLEITSIVSSTQFYVRAETSATAAWPNATYNTAPSVTSTASWFLTAGLGNNFVPPWGPWSTMKCTDCHTSNTSTDPMGPHGSAMKYILVQSTTQIFNYWNGTAVVAQTNTPVDGDNFCINCHRKDVYGDYGVAGTNPTWSRQAHPIDASGTGRSLAKKSKWGPVCMNCHGGARAGGIHGQNLGKGDNGTAGSYSGKRLLGGATWSGVTRSTTTTAGSCYVKGATTDAVNNCGNGNQGSFSGTGGSGGTGTAQYQFDEGL